MIPISFSSLPLPLHVRQPKRRKIGLLKGLEIGSECRMNTTAGKNGFLAAGYTASGFLLLLSFCSCSCNALSAVFVGQSAAEIERMLANSVFESKSTGWPSTRMPVVYQDAGRLPGLCLPNQQVPNAGRDYRNGYSAGDQNTLPCGLFSQDEVKAGNTGRE